MARFGDNSTYIISCCCLSCCCYFLSLCVEWHKRVQKTKTPPPPLERRQKKKKRQPNRKLLFQFIYFVRLVCGLTLSRGQGINRSIKQNKVGDTHKTTVKSRDRTESNQPTAATVAVPMQISQASRASGVPSLGSSPDWDPISSLLHLPPLPLHSHIPCVTAITVACLFVCTNNV